MSGGIVLDAWAALAFLQREGPAALVVRRLLRRAARGNIRLLINAVNLGEVYYRLLQTAGAKRADERLALLRHLPIAVCPVRETLALSAARMKAAHRSRMRTLSRWRRPRVNAPVWQRAIQRLSLVSVVKLQRT